MTAVTTPSERRSDPAITAFRIIAIAEAISWAGLLIAMAFKYSLTKTATGVEIMGPIHGVVFIAYLIVTLVVASRLEWNIKLTLIGLFAAVPPFATVVFEVWAGRAGHLEPPAATTKTPARPAA